MTPLATAGALWFLLSALFLAVIATALAIGGRERRPDVESGAVLAAAAFVCYAFFKVIATIGGAA